MSTTPIGNNGPVSGASGGGGPQNQQNDYSKMSDEQLKQKLNDPNTSPEEKKKIAEELVKRAEQKANEDCQNGVPGAEEDQKKLQEILKKLQNGEQLTQEDKDFLKKQGIDMDQSDPNQV